MYKRQGEETFAELVAYYEGRGAAELINIHGITFREEEKQDVYKRQG